MSALELDTFREAIGRRGIETRETLDLWTCLMYHRTFVRDAAEPDHGSLIPPGWHFLYDRPGSGLDELRPDGMPARSSVVPDIPLPRRMFAGEEITWYLPVHIGDTVTQSTVLDSVEEKTGSSGDLVFVGVRQEIKVPDGVAISGVAKTVFRGADRSTGNASNSPHESSEPRKWTRSASVTLNAVQLFRYSALTFNSHRIHYDHLWVTRQEGYPGLVVQGRLTSLLLLGFGMQQWPDATPRRYTYRAVNPVFADTPVALCAIDNDKGAELAAVLDDGRVAMRAVLEVE
ncbi:MaoC family dehydratase N-terminal domain-containing protein [Streptomyces sp. NPDC046909]|uniref:FAS1-like dehydratase domain-containing protein n=1 Tax=Streptomyces sp. NPDC046909 TaxID=3155617 RepID=UPI0033F31CA0